MPPHLPSPDVPRPCPACDYDLRAISSERCPECGTIVGLGPLSKVPWVYRMYRGDRRAYGETFWLLIRHPARLAEEAAHRVQVSHARRFHHESILLASILASGCLTLAFLMRGPTIEQLLSPSSRYIVNTQTALLPGSPAFVLSDTLFMLLPLFVSVFASFHASMFIYRLIFALGGGPGADAGRLRRRAFALAYYASGITPLLALFIGGTITLAIARTEMTYPMNPFWITFVPAGLILFPIAAIWTFFFPTLTLLKRAGRAGSMRIFAMAYLFPLLQPALWIAISTAIFWLTGYVTIALWSTTH